ncbi:RNA 2',3'-cyclic phosphodiesterase [Pseudomonas indica]|uniref:RNA 2',3'-cyclic phosphodiesterase n=1 Tax=Pseudomonas indica TaxID=137658 RepID=UPI0023F8C22D|nr:RNA 2',3'-cyclic phosphodiesterase [Pseudomonas indica]MBU3054946.1 RNA 2',3'-cyclic phosphodiesterase [Pseudomonas indica]
MTTPSLRLFFALPCPLELARAIADWRDALELDGKPVAATNLHLTLAFLGSQPRGRVDELKSLASACATGAFALRLDRLGCWRNGLLHLDASHPPEALLQLERQLRQALLGAGFEPERRPFHAHLTLARRCTRMPAGVIPTFDWLADRFSLFVSENSPKGTHYRTLADWPLRVSDTI